MNLTLEQVVASIYPNGIVTTELMGAVNLIRRLIQAAGPGVTEESDRVQPARKGILRTVSSTAALVRKAKRSSAPKSGPNASKREVFLSSLKVGGTMTEITARAGVSGTYGFPILHELRREGRPLTVTKAEGRGGAKIYKLEE